MIGRELQDSIEPTAAHSVRPEVDHADQARPGWAAGCTMAPVGLRQPRDRPRALGSRRGEWMRFTKLGSTAVDVWSICLGCMSYGVPERGNHLWSLPEEQSRPFVQRALEAGINFFDTANVYSDGTSEEIVGRALADFANRDEIVLATKVNGRMRRGANGAGLSRKAIMSEIDASLRRLGTDYVDLYQIHRWDPTTPIEETMEALHDVVKAGKARYIGASSMWAWQFAKAQYTADAHGWTRFVSMQNHYNLLYREEEREMLPLCADLGVGVIPWSPLARGRLTREWDATTARSETDEFGRSLYQPHDRLIVEQVARIAADRGVPRAQVALAWMLSKPVITAPIVGATKPAAPRRRHRRGRPGPHHRRGRAARGAVHPARRGRVRLTGPQPVAGVHGAPDALAATVRSRRRGLPDCPVSDNDAAGLPSHSESIRIDAPPAKVWDLVTAMERYGEWSSENTGGRWRKGADGELGTGKVGDQFVGLNRRDGTEWKALVEIVEREEQRSYGFVTGGTELNLALWRYELPPTVTARPDRAVDDAQSRLLPQAGRRGEIAQRGRTPRRASPRRWRG